MSVQSWNHPIHCRTPSSHIHTLIHTQGDFDPPTGLFVFLGAVRQQYCIIMPPCYTYKHISTAILFTLILATIQMYPHNTYTLHTRYSHIRHTDPTNFLYDKNNHADIIRINVFVSSSLLPCCMDNLKHHS